MKHAVSLSLVSLCAALHLGCASESEPSETGGSSEDDVTAAPKYSRRNTTLLGHWELVSGECQNDLCRYAEIVPESNDTWSILLGKPPADGEEDTRPWYELEPDNGWLIFGFLGRSAAAYPEVDDLNGFVSPEQVDGKWVPTLRITSDLEYYDANDEHVEERTESVLRKVR